MIYANYWGIRYPINGVIRRGKQINVSEYEVIKNSKVIDCFPEIWRQLYEPGDTVLDVGAYIGLISVGMALCGGIVHAFEPSPRNFPRLQKVVKPLERQIHLHNVALGNSNKTTIEEGFKFVGNSSIDCVPMEGKFEFHWTTYDEYAAKEKINDPAFVKMDIEGNESVALVGMENLIKKIRPCWQIEYHAWNQTPVEQGGFDFSTFNEYDYVFCDEKFNRIQLFKPGQIFAIPKDKYESL